jgi:methionyl-tRNA formyltransferase
VAVLADYGRIVPAPLLGVPERGFLNLHPSLLPRHRGSTPIPEAILAGDAETGVTLFEMDEQLDHGPIVAQRRVPLPADATARTMEPSLAGVAAALLAEGLHAWLAGELPPVPQDEHHATLSRPLHRADGHLDPARPAAELERQVRAYDPWPGTFLDLASGRLAVRAAAFRPSQTGDVAGAIVDEGTDGVALATVDGRLELVEVQPAGGRPMSGSSWRRGHRDQHAAAPLTVGASR